MGHCLLANQLSHFCRDTSAHQVKSQLLKLALSKFLLFDWKAEYFFFTEVAIIIVPILILFSPNIHITLERFFSSHPKSFPQHMEERKYTTCIYLVLWVLENVFIYATPLDHLGDKQGRNSHPFLTNEKT